MMNTHALTRALVAALAAGALAIPTLAAAQTTPSYAQPASAAPPSYAAPNRGEAVRGEIVAIQGKYDLTVRDARGYVDHVRMHQGTVINPTGASLVPGMRVTIYGENAGPVLAANEIDTPLRVTYVEPYGPYPDWGLGVRFGWPGARFGGFWR
jgi:hypothetical protein